ncbi:LysM peptidoglycan-binding domain-containing protein [Aestuariimicrobium kwangyangense]|uniref:LysM peptidoglycan-binding domain-containing protein n=1 Tax=Aestuariimicrobium kwangyangense TaxID=396389 RepID=UPI0003B6022A|nr:LysM peptidoglycan-binding domain-containing protein [Aestuariimicrobium kwangyangense]
MRLLRALGALVALTALLLGVPAALFAWGDLGALAPSRWGTLWSGAATAGTVIAVVTLVGWACWVLLMVSTVAEVVATLSGDRVRWRVPLTGWVQPIVAGLLAAVVAGLPGVSSMERFGEHEPMTPPSIAVPSSVAESDVAAAPGSIRSSDAEPSLSSSRSVHVVADGEELWTIAENRYGDGQRWQQIAEANGLTLDSPILPGMRLVLPGVPQAQAVAGPGAPPQSAPDRVVVRAGDSLWTIAEEHLGDPERWPEIADLNRTLIIDPDEIEVGWTIVLPHAEEEDPPSPAPIPEDSEQDPWQAEPTGTPADPSATSTPTTTASPDATGAGQPPSGNTAAPATSPAPPPTQVGPPSARPHSDTDDAPLFTREPLRLLAGGLTAALAAAVSAGLVVRHRIQSDQRDLGRRPVPAGESSRRLEAVWAAQADEATEPSGVTGTTVIVGETLDEQQPVTFDLTGVTVVRGPEALTRDLLGAVCTCLASAEWSATTEVVVVGRGLAWTTALDSPMLRYAPEAAVELRAAAERAHHRRVAADELDADLAEVVVFADLLEADERDLLIEVFEDAPGMAAVVIDNPGRTPWTRHGCVIRVDDEATARVGEGAPFVPCLVGAPARRALIDLHASATTTETTRAPWWADDPPPGVSTIHNPPDILEEASMTAVDAHRDRPTLLLLGPIQLVGTRGTRPSRAVKACEEYCGWLLENPGQSSQKMAQSLMVAEATRRSNMSRLRVWLGADERGQQFLPEAYTGRIQLHPGVSSDWDELQLLIQAGVNRTPSQALVQALQLVRGEPLADAAPGLWHWAEQWRRDMIATLRDIALVLGQRSLDSDDLEVARWALKRGLACAPTDELLLSMMIRVEHRLGNRGEAERLVMLVTRLARTRGYDLRVDTVMLIQEVMEGRIRTRKA